MTRMALPRRQLDVLRGLADGLTAAQIASRHGLGLNTVKTHTRNLYATLGAANGPHAVALGFQCGLLRARQ